MEGPGSIDKWTKEEAREEGGLCGGSRRVEYDC